MMKPTNTQSTPDPEPGRAPEVAKGTPEPKVTGPEIQGAEIPTSTEAVVARVPSAEGREALVAGAGIGYRIATFTIFLLVVLGLFVYGLFRIKHVLELFTIGLLIAMAINPMVEYLERRGVKRFLSVSGLLLVLAAALFSGMAVLVPRVIDQATEFVQNYDQNTKKLSRYVDKLEKRFPHLHVKEMTTKLQSESASRLAGMQGVATTVATTSVTTVFEVTLVVFIVVFFLVDPAPLVRGMRGLMPDQWQPEVQRIGELAVGKVEAWIQGSLLLMLTIAVADTVGLLFLGIPYALLWGVFSGLLEIVPTIGPIISAIPPALVALTISPTKALWVLGLYTVVQQVESNALVPLIMANKVRLHPITLLFFLLMMAEFLGIFGALIATPLAAVIKVLYMELYYRRLHGTLPEEEVDDPIRMKILKRFSKKVDLGEPPGPAEEAVVKG